jgi:hypothetical protein
VRAAVLLGFVLLAGCRDLTTVDLSAEDGILAFRYEGLVSGLPASWSPEEIPDGTYVLEGADEVRLDVRTTDDGGREVTIERDAQLLSAATVRLYRDLFGADRVAAISGMSLELLELQVDSAGGVIRPPDLAAGTTTLSVAVAVGLADTLVDEVRHCLLEAHPLTIPLRMTFHLGPQDLDMLPPDLHISVRVQPTLHVDILSL